jgi:hypothetical protein
MAGNEAVLQHAQGGPAAAKCGSHRQGQGQIANFKRLRSQIGNLYRPQNGAVLDVEGYHYFNAFRELPRLG